MVDASSDGTSKVWAVPGFVGTVVKHCGSPDQPLLIFTFGRASLAPWATHFAAAATGLELLLTVNSRSLRISIQLRIWLYFHHVCLLYYVYTQTCLFGEDETDLRKALREGNALFATQAEGKQLWWSFQSSFYSAQWKYRHDYFCVDKASSEVLSKRKCFGSEFMCFFSFRKYFTRVYPNCHYWDGIADSIITELEFFFFFFFCCSWWFFFLSFCDHANVQSCCSWVEEFISFDI